MHKFLFFLLIILFPMSGKAQPPVQPLDTVFMMSGKIVTGYVKDTSAQQVRMLVPKKGNFKADFIDQELVFSVKYGKTGNEVVFYKQDTLFGNYYTPQEVRYFLQGERDARLYYRCPLWTTSAFLVGVAGGYTRSMLGLLPPFGFSALSVAFRIPIRPGTVSYPQNLKYDTYLLGYEKQARQRRTLRTLAAGGIGFVAGFAISSAINQN
ncbi:MAG: hypothetical protein ACRC3B_07270 [Bacteroidia bacterium]